MPARKIPIIWSSSKEKEQILLKYVPDRLRVVRICQCSAPEVFPTALVVGVGVGTSTLFYSENSGITWTGLGNSIFTTRGRGVYCNGKIWVAVGDGTNTIAYSYDGKKWTGLGNSIVGAGYSVSWNGSMWLVGGDTKIAYSSNGREWTTVNVNIDKVYSIAWNGTTWVIVGEKGSSSSQGIGYSTDAINWSYTNDTDLNNLGILTDVVYYDSKFTAVGSSFGSVYSKVYSSNITDWTTIAVTNYTQGMAIEKFNSIYFSVGTPGAVAETSSDGLTWSTATDANLNSVAANVSVFTGRGVFFFCNQQLFLCGGSQIGYTSDGITWNKFNFSVSGSSITAAYSFA